MGGTITTSLNDVKYKKTSPLIDYGRWLVSCYIVIPFLSWLPGAFPVSTGAWSHHRV